MNKAPSNGTETGADSPGNRESADGRVIDQRQQQIDPAGKHRDDPNRRSDANRKQPGASRGAGQGDQDRASQP